MVSFSKVLKTYGILILILLLAISVRIYAFLAIPVIPKDAPLYLYQAMVVKTGDLKLLDLCEYSSRVSEINLFSISIIPFYYITKDWELAGKLVSFFSGSLSIVLLYFILKNFFSGSVLYLTLLVYSLNPLLVKESTEVLRESFFTLMVLAGMLCFLKGLNSISIKKFFWFFISNVFWILSSWIRIEGVFLIIFSILYLFIGFLFTKNKKEGFVTWLSFSLFPFIVGFLFLGYVSFYKSFILSELTSKVQISKINPFSQPFAQTLENFEYLDIPSPTPYFWDMVKQNLWLIALGTTLFYKFIPTIHISNIIFILASFKNLKSYLKIYFIRYLAILSLVYIIFLWYFTFTNWYMEKRYMIPLLFLISPFIAIGIDNCKKFIESIISKTSIKDVKKISIFILASYILIFSMIDVIKPRREELKEFKNIAYRISKELSYQEIQNCSKSGCKNLILTGDRRIIFYLSNFTKLPLCPSVDKYFYIKLGKLPEEQIINYITSNNYKVVILDTKIFKEKTEVIKVKLENLGILTYVIK